MWKLAFNVGTFAFFNLNYLVFYVYAEYWTVVGSKCVGIENVNENSLLLVRGITFALQKFRIIVDPIVTFCVDKAVSIYIN